MKTVLLILGVLAATFVGGCEDVVQVELNSTEPRLVIEGYLSNTTGNFQITRSTDFYNPNDFERVSGALVVVSDETGAADTLQERGILEGVYYFVTDFASVVGGTYYATVTVDGQTFTAATTMMDQIPIDSMAFEYEEGNKFVDEGEEEDGYRLHVFFRDTPNKPDYARILLRKHFRRGQFTDWYSNLYLYNGRLSDGKTVNYSSFFKVFQPGEGAEVILLSMEKTMYEYFLTLSEVSATVKGDVFDVTPANPNSNWSGGALGYFGAFNSVYAVKVVEPE